jgi:nicotinamide riboside kinase/phosphopantetheinyl transferase
MKFIWSGKDNKIQGTEVAEIGHFGLCIARIPLQQAAVFEATDRDWSAFFSPADHARWLAMQGGPRRTAFLAARIALSGALQKSSWQIKDLSYEADRPVLPKGFISLSHGGSWAMAAYHPLLEVGIDVEGSRSQLSKVIKRVASERECREFEEPFIWGAKESVYKAAGHAGLDWRREIEVQGPQHAFCTRGRKRYALESFTMEQDQVVIALRKPLRIVVTGPESSGKSLLTARLARHFSTLWTTEVAREYLAEHGADYEPEDLLCMARLQAQHSQEFAESSLDLVFDDTDLLTYRIWFLEKYGRPSPEIEAMPLEGDLYLLCMPDLAWAADPLREYPREADRQRHFELHKEFLEKEAKPYALVSGQGSARTMNALRALEALGILP